MLQNAISIFLLLFNVIIQFYSWLAILHVIFSWLIGFNIININHPIMQKIVDFIYSMMTPIYDWIYRFLRPIGGGIIGFLDLRPLLFLLFLHFFCLMVHSWSSNLINLLS